MFCIPHTTLSCPSLSSKKVTTTQTTKTTFLSYSQKCCPRLSLVVVKKTRQHKQQRQHFYLIPKVLSKVVPRCRQNKHDNTNNKDNISISKSVVQGCLSLSSKKHDNIDNKDNISFLFQKCCPRLSLVVVKKIIFS